MEIVERQVGGVTVLELKGRLVLTDGDTELRDTIDRLLTQGRQRLLLNLADLSYVDSSGIGVIVGKYISVGKRGGRLALCNLNPQSFHVLSVTKLITVFDAFQSEAEGVENLAKAVVSQNSAEPGTREAPD